MVIKEVWGEGQYPPEVITIPSFMLLLLGPSHSWKPGSQTGPCLSNMIPISSQLPRTRESTYVFTLPPFCAPWSFILVQASLAWITAASPTAGLLLQSSSTPRKTEHLACKPDLSVHLANPPRAPIVSRVTSKCFNVTYTPFHDSVLVDLSREVLRRGLG